MNWIIIILAIFLITGVIVFTILHNLKDKKESEGKLKNDYPKRKKEGDIETDE